MNVESWNSVFQWGSVGLVAITFFFGAGALWTGNRINARQTARILTLETDLAKANTQLSGQLERTAKAERDAAEAKTIAGKAGEGTLKALKDVAVASERTETLAIEAGKQQERAAKAEKELLELRERIKPRTLSIEARATLTDGLKASANKGAVLVACIVGDSESCSFAEQIRLCLQSAGWSVTPEPGAVPTMTGYGLIVRVRDVKAAPKHAADLQRILKTVGLSTGVESVPAMTADRVMLWVGSKE